MKVICSPTATHDVQWSTAIHRNRYAFSVVELLAITLFFMQITGLPLESLPVLLFIIGYACFIVLGLQSAKKGIHKLVSAGQAVWIDQAIYVIYQEVRKARRRAGGGLARAELDYQFLIANLGDPDLPGMLGRRASAIAARTR